MGCGGTKIFVTNDRVPGQNEKALSDIKKLGLSQEEINTFYAAFCKMDKNRGIALSSDRTEEI